MIFKLFTLHFFSGNLTRQKFLAVFLLALVLSFLVYGNGIDGDFVFDDRAVIVGNPLIEDFSGIFEAFLRPYHYARPQSGLYRPLTFTSFVFDWHLFSGNPAGFHVVNIILHAVAVFLIFLFVSSLKDRATAFISSLIFLFLPIHVEAVTSIVGRGELLMFVFFMAAFCSVQKRYYKTAASFFFLSLLSKETGAAFIPIFIVYEFIWNKRSAWKLFKKSVYFLLPLAFYAAFRYNALGFEYFINTNAYSFFNPIKTMEFFSGLWTVFKVLYLYVQKIIFPTYFSSDYSYNQIVAVNNLFASWQAVAGVAVFAALVFLSVAKRNNLAGLGALIFIFPYLVVSNLVVKTGTIMAERLMYLPSLGIVIIAVAAVESFKLKIKSLAQNKRSPPSRTWQQNFKINDFASPKDLRSQNILPLLTPNKKLRFHTGHALRFILLTLLVLLLVAYGIQTVKGNTLWKNEKTLFENAYERAPNSVVNITNIASVFFKENKNEEALSKINTALEIEPKNSPTLHLAGQIYDSMGDEKTAEEFWQRAVQAQPDYLYPYLSLGALYYRKGDFKSGKKILLKAQEMYNTPNVVTLLSFNKIGLGEHREVIGLIEERFGAKPKIYELRFVLGVAYLMSGDDLTARELLLELKDPALTEEVFLQNLKDTKIFNVEI